MSVLTLGTGNASRNIDSFAGFQGAWLFPRIDTPVPQSDARSWNMLIFIVGSVVRERFAITIESRNGGSAVLGTSSLEVLDLRV